MSTLRDPVTAYVALGANLGNAQQTVLVAMEALSLLPQTRLTGRSHLYCTAPHEAQGPDFVNAVAQLETRLTAPDLLRALQGMETRAGRLRPHVNAPRTLDLDVLFYGQAHISSAELIVPHPRWRERAFVLYPLADVWPGSVSTEDLARVEAQGVRRLIG
ncbi:2-amino-4-hydroxy-6-hydroxymethyldihydropteridine diphosphokinase [uncultured Limnohabitans sp.]|uniref:2-amino-4-hydroxy-6- hydroxymethyldihydropteridine diphosphokinase n=1 Tax=uncultured Limnohabitans sp. TaxID=768543 RepID=UPI00344B4031